MLKNMKLFVTLACLSASPLLLADTVVTMNLTAEHGIGPSVGTVTIVENKYGLLFMPNLHDITPGLHGLHIHQNPSCDDNGMAAGGHWDPNNRKHLGPYNDKAHRGDLPALYVGSDGTATLPVLAPRLKHLAAIQNHALMIHDGGDNYSDSPEKLGGGGKRMICGVIKK